MKGTKLITLKDVRGDKLSYPIWMILEEIDKLSDQDKADFATDVVRMIGDNDLALSVLQQRCRDCGRHLSFDERCYCTADE